MIILGIDPGLALTGWGVVEKIPLGATNEDKPKLIEYGCIKTSKNQEPPQRLLKIYQELHKIIKKYKPRVLSLEKLFFNTNAKTAFSIGEVRGIIKICAVLNKVPVVEFTPLQIKNSIVGYGRASKKQVQEMVKISLTLKEIPKPDDIADAIGVALTYCYYNNTLKS